MRRRPAAGSPTASARCSTALRASGPRPAGGDLAALRRLAGRGLVVLERRAVRRS